MQQQWGVEQRFHQPNGLRHWKIVLALTGLVSGHPLSTLAPTAAATRGNRYINERAKPATGQQSVVRWRIAAPPPGRAPVCKNTRTERRADILRGITFRTSHIAGAVEANGLVPLGLCGHCGRVSQQVPLQSRTGRNPAAWRYSVYVEIVPSSPVYPTPVYKLGLIVSTRSNIRVMIAQI